MQANFRKFKLFTYRSCPGMRCFNVADSFIYVVADSYIAQIPRRTALVCSQSVSYHTISTLIHGNLIYMVSPNGLAYFDGTLHEIGRCRPLSVSFAVGRYVCTLEENSMLLFSVDSKQVHRRVAIKGVAGLCTAAHAVAGSLLLGYEDGRVYHIENPEDKLVDRTGQPEGFPAHSLGPDAMRLVVDIKEPVLSLAASGGHAYLSALSGKLVKTKKEERSFAYTEVAAPLKKIIYHEDVLIGFEGRCIALYSSDLRLLAFCTQDFSVVDIFILGQSLYVGYDCSLIVEYDIAGVISDVKRRK